MGKIKEEFLMQDYQPKINELTRLTFLGLIEIIRSLRANDYYSEQAKAISEETKEDEFIFDLQLGYK